MKHLNCVEVDNRPHKTRAWVVYSVATHIGMVRWYSPWRRYAYFPEANTLYEETCLRDLATFCEQQTKAHRAARKAARS